MEAQAEGFRHHDTPPLGRVWARSTICAERIIDCAS